MPVAGPARCPIADRLSRIAVLFPASRLISSAVNRSGYGDAASERGRFFGDWSYDRNSRRRVFLGGFLGDEKRPKGNRHLVNQARYEAAQAHAVQDPFGQFEDSYTQLAGSIAALGTPEAEPLD